MITEKRPCGFWCPRVPEEPHDTSHGICDECAQKLRDQSDARHWKDVPSYVGDRKAFNKYIQERKYARA